MNKLLLTSVALTAIATGANAITLAEWDTAGFSGTETSISQSASSIEGVTISNITLGSSIGSTSGGGGINTNGWSSSSVGTTGATSGYYVGFSITVASDYELTLDTLSLTGRSSNTGPGNLGVYYSGNSYATDMASFSQSGTSYTVHNLNLSTIVLSAGTYDFRIALVDGVSANGGAVAGGGTFRLMNPGSTGASSVGENPISLSGTLQAVPEPGTYAAIAGLMVLGLVVVRRRRR